MNGVSCQMSISISFQSKFVLNGNAMVDNDSWLDLTKKSNLCIHSLNQKGCYVSMFNFVSQTCHNTLQNYLKLQGYMFLIIYAIIL